MLRIIIQKYIRFFWSQTCCVTKKQPQQHMEYRRVPFQNLTTPKHSQKFGDADVI